MRKSLLFLLISLFAAIVLAGCLAYVPGPPPLDGVYAPGPPPEPVVEVVPALPYPGAVWIGGYWAGVPPGIIGTAVTGGVPPIGARPGRRVLAPLPAGLCLAPGSLAIRFSGEAAKLPA